MGSGPPREAAGRLAIGDPAGALEAINEAGQASPGPVGLLNPVPTRRAQLLLAQGDLQAAARFMHVQGVGPADKPDYSREPEQLLLARVLLAQGRPGQALALLDRMHAAAAVEDRTGLPGRTGCGRGRTRPARTARWRRSGLRSAGPLGRYEPAEQRGHRRALVGEDPDVTLRAGQRERPGQAS